MVESRKMTSDVSLHDLMVDKWLQGTKVSSKETSVIELLSNQVRIFLLGIS